MWASSAPMLLLSGSWSWSSSSIDSPSTAASVVARAYVNMPTSRPMIGEYPGVGSMRIGDGCIRSGASMSLAEMTWLPLRLHGGRRLRRLVQDQSDRASLLFARRRQQHGLTLGHDRRLALAPDDGAAGRLQACLTGDGVPCLRTGVAVHGGGPPPPRDRPPGRRGVFRPSAGGGRA